LTTCLIGSRNQKRYATLMNNPCDGQSDMISPHEPPENGDV
jgi:hypothetical protein